MKRLTSLVVLLINLTGFAQELPPAMPKVASPVLEVSKGAKGEILSVRWKTGTTETEALNADLRAVVTADPKSLLTHPKVAHAVVVIPLGHRLAPLGDVVVLRPGIVNGFPKEGKGLVEQEPTDVAVSRWGFFFTRDSGAKFTVEHYDITKDKLEVLQTLEAVQVGRQHKVKLSDEVATIISDGKSVEYRPNGRRAESTLVYQDLAQGNIDTIEGSFGGVDLTKKALDGQLDPDESEIELATQMAAGIRRNRLQKSVLLWGIPGTDNRGVVHLFATKVANAKEDEAVFGWFKGWKVYQLSWSKFNTEGLVDVAANKATSLVDAAKHKKVILFFDQVEQLVGLGSNKGASGDVASVFISHMKAGELIVIGATSSDGVPTLRARSDFFDQFTEVQITEAKGERLFTKLRQAADRKKGATRVNLPDASLRRIIEVTDRYLPDKGQPEKSLGAIEALISEHTPLKKAKEGVEPEDVPIVDVDVPKVMLWISKAARIGTLAEGSADTLTQFILSKEFDAAMDKRMAGQAKAKAAVRDALFSIAKGMRQTNAAGHEIGIETLLFVGPSGTGKSFLHEQLSKVLAEKDILLPYEEPIEGSYLTDGDQAVRTLIGAAPGYEGYEKSGEGGLFYQMVKRSPQSIIVLEEFDKVHKKIDQILYTFLDSAKVVNAAGKKAMFTRGLFILTANFGVEGSGGDNDRDGQAANRKGSVCNYIDRWDRQNLFPKGDPLHLPDEKMAKWNEEALKVGLFNCLKENKLVNAQILGRIGRSNLVVFHHFTRKETETIRDQQLDKVIKDYAKSHKAKLVITPEVRQWLFEFAWGDDGMLTFNVGARGIVDAVKAEIAKPLIRFAAIQGDKALGKTWKVTLNTDSDGAEFSLE